VALLRRPATERTPRAAGPAKTRAAGPAKTRAATRSPAAPATLAILAAGALAVVALLLLWSPHPATAATTPTTAPPPVTGTTVAGTTVAGTTVAGTTVAGTTVAGTTVAGTTVAPIGNQLPSPSVTLPLTTRPESVHVDPLLAKLSLAGFALFLLLLIVQSVLTRPRRRGRWTL
jgi:hypothetical protein